MKRFFVLVLVLFLVACDIFVIQPITEPTPAKFMPTETPAPTHTPEIPVTVQAFENKLHFNASVRGDIPVLNVRNSIGVIVSDRLRGHTVLVVGRAESLSGLTVEVASEGEFDGWWCQLEPIDDDLWVACDLLNGSRFDFDGN